MFVEERRVCSGNAGAISTVLGHKYALDPHSIPNNFGNWCPDGERLEGLERRGARVSNQKNRCFAATILWKQKY